MIAKTMDRAYGGQLTLEVSAYFVIFTGLLFDLYEIFINPYMVRRSARATVLIAWVTVYFCQLLIINRICEKTSYQVMKAYAMLILSQEMKCTIGTKEFFGAVTSNS